MNVAQKRRILRRSLLSVFLLEGLLLRWGFGAGWLHLSSTSLLGLTLTTLSVYNATLIGVSIWATPRRASRPRRTR